MERFLNAAKRHMAAMDAGMPQPRWGIVQSVDPSRPAARVTVQPEGVLSGWLPISAPLAGNGWGVIALPLPGDMAFLLPEGGGDGDYVIVGSAHNDGARPPQPSNTIGTGGTLSTASVPVVPREICLVSASGVVVRLCADGTLYMRGDTYLDGNLHVNGDVFDKHGSLNRLRGNYNEHTHTQGNDGHGDAEVPTNTTSAPDPE